MKHRIGHKEMTIRLKEKTIQLGLTKYYSKLGYVVKREVCVPVGRIDLILYRPNEKILIEVKEQKNIKHAYGQVLSYKKYHKDATRLVVAYFHKNGKYEGIDSSFLSDNKVDFINVHTILNLEELIDIQATIEEYSNPADIATHLFLEDLEEEWIEDYDYIEKELGISF